MQNHFLRFDVDSKEIHPLRDPSMAIKGASRCSEKFYKDLVQFLDMVGRRKNLGLPLNKSDPPELERLVKPIEFNKAQL